MKNLAFVFFSPSITIWQIFNVLILLFVCYLVFLLSRYLFFKNRQNKNTLLTLILSVFVLSSCGDLSDRLITPSKNGLQVLIEKYNLKEDSNLSTENSFVFNSLDEMETFIRAIEDRELNSDIIQQYKPKADFEKMKNTQNSFQKQTNQTPEVFNMAGDCTRAWGWWSGSMAITMWNSMNVGVSLRDGNVDNVSTWLSGFTLGLGAEMKGWSVVSNYRGRVVIDVQVVYQYNLFYEGAGTVYQRPEKVRIFLDPCGGGNGEIMKMIVIK